MPSAVSPTRFDSPRPSDRLPAFSEELRALTARIDDQPMQIGTLLQQTEGRGLHLTLVIIALPFVTPVPLPGVSIPFGAAIALIGLRLISNRASWMPRAVMRRELPPRFLNRLLPAAGAIMRALECFLRPRLTFLEEHKVFRRTAGVLIGACGILLMLPVPLPLSNSLPAWTVLLLAAGALERDGLFFILGCLAFVLTAAFFTLLAFAWIQTWESYTRFATLG